MPPSKVKGVSMKSNVMALSFISPLYHNGQRKVIMTGKRTKFALAWTLFFSAAISCLANPGNPKYTPLTTGATISGSPSISPDGSAIYITSEDGNLYAINISTGSELWSVNVPTGPGSIEGELISSPAVGCDGTIFVVSSDLNLVSINSNGGINWKLPLPGGVESPGAVAIGSNSGTVYVTADDDSLLSAVTNLDSTTPSFGWSLDLGSVFKSSGAFVESAPTIGPDGTIYLCAASAGSGNQLVYLVAVQDNTNSATVKWIVNLGYSDDANDFHTSLVVDNNGRIYAPYCLSVNNSTTSLQAFKTSDGAPVWSLPFSTPPTANFPNGAPILTSPALSADGTTIYIGADDGVLYAINTNGTQKWSYDTTASGNGSTTPSSGPIRSSPAVASDGSIIFGANNGMWSVKDNGTSAGFQWQQSPTVSGINSAPLNSSPLIAGSDNAIYFGGSDGNIYALQGSAPLAASDWPLFGGNVRRMEHQGLPSTNCFAPELSVVINYPPTIYKDTYSPTSTSFTISRQWAGPALNVDFFLGGDASPWPSDNTVYAQYPQDFTPSNCTYAHAPNSFGTTIPANETSVKIEVTAVNGNHISSSQSLILSFVGGSGIYTNPAASQAVGTINDPNGGQ